VQRKTRIRAALLLLSGVGLASLIHPYGDVRKGGPPEVIGVFPGSCQNCHSETTEWPLYSHVAPISWMIERDVHEARAHMNLSHWNDYDAEKREQLLSEIGSVVRNHRMPPARYLLMHPEARLSDADTEALYRWTRAQRRLLRTSR
jgi:hypothetical protein